MAFELNHSLGYYVVTGIGSVTGSHVVVPMIYNGYSVAAIDEQAFRDCTQIIEITLPSTMMYFGRSALSGCTNLTTIHYEGTPDEWHNVDIYDGNEVLSFVTVYCNGEAIPQHTYSDEWYYDNDIHWIPLLCEHADKQVYVGQHTFDEDGYCSVCGKNQGLTFSITEDGQCTVRGRGSSLVIGHVIIPETYNGHPVTGIQYQAFSECVNMTGIEIPDSVTSIGDLAFYHTGLTSLHIPAGVTSIGSAAVVGCPDMTSITVDPANPVYHSSGNCLIHTADKILVAGCVNSVIPGDGSVTIIGDDAFIESKLTDIDIPDCVTTIGHGAFLRCAELTTICLGYGLNHISQSAISDCGKLTTVYYNGTPDMWDAVHIDYYNDSLYSASVICKS